LLYRLSYRGTRANSINNSKIKTYATQKPTPQTLNVCDVTLISPKTASELT
jgi:hypothetical protein